MTLKFNPLKIFVCVMIIAMMAADLFTIVGIPLVGNADEITCIVAWVGILFYLFYRQMIPKEALKILFFLAIFLGIGLCGNVLSEITQNTQYILMDMFMFTKPYSIYLFMTIFLTETNARSALRSLKVIGKAMLWILFFFSVISQYVFTFMISDSGTFVFYANYSGSVSWWVILFLSVIWVGRNSDREVICYMILSGIIIFFNQSGLGMIAFGLGTVLFVFSKIQKKVKWYSILICVALCFFLGKDEIKGYLFNEDAPRAILLKYAFVTADTYFPLGSGFATYGSNAAIREYSPLYIQYGFNKIGGMTESYHPYLMDNYYQQIIGQLGYVGFALLLWFMYRIIQKILNVKDPHIRSASLMLYICLIFAGIGFGTASSWGCTVYMLIPMFCLTGKKSKGSLNSYEKEPFTYYDRQYTLSSDRCRN